jgi:hypothetical protein
MTCEELAKLRKQATQIKKRMDEQKRKARSKAAHPRSGRPSGKSEYVPLLQHKLSRLAERIEHHISEHRCQE